MDLTRRLGLLTPEIVGFLGVCGIVALALGLHLRRNVASSAYRVTVPAAVLAIGVLIAAILNPLFLSARVARELAVIAGLRRPLEGLIGARTPDEFASFFLPESAARSHYDRWQPVFVNRHLEGRRSEDFVASTRISVAPGGQETARDTALFRLQGRRDTVTLRVTGVHRGDSRLISEIQIVR